MLSTKTLCFRIDFHPNPNGHVRKAGSGKGCIRCGHNVYEAEKIIAAGRVSQILESEVLVVIAV